MRTILSAACLGAVLVSSAAEADNKDKDRDRDKGKGSAAVVLANELEADAQAFTLSDLFKVAVHSAPDLEHAAFEIGRVDASVDTAQGPHDFKIVSTADFNRTRGAPIPPLTIGSASDTLAWTFGFSKLLPTNGTLELLSDFRNTQSDQGGSESRTVTSGIKLRLTQPLLKGFGPWVYNKNVRVNTKNRDALQIRRRATAREFAASMIESYWNLALAWRVLEIRRANYLLGVKQLAFTEGAVRTGRIAKAELLSVQTAIAVREQDILSAEVEVVKASIELRKIAGLEISGRELVIKPEELPNIETEEVGELATYVDEALAKSDELRASALEVAAAVDQLRGDDSDLLPKLDLRIEGGPLGTDSTTRDDTGIITHEPTVAGSIDRINNGGYSLLARLDFELPIGRHLAKGTHNYNRTVLASLRHGSVEKRANLAADVAQLVYVARADVLRAQLGVKAIASAEAEVVAEQAKFEVGKSTNSEIVRRQADLEEIKLRHAVAVAEYLVVRAKLEAATDKILQKYGITIRGKFTMREVEESETHDHEHAPGAAPGAAH